VCGFSDRFVRVSNRNRAVDGFKTGKSYDRTELKKRGSFRDIKEEDDADGECLREIAQHGAC
jgi:hypothetical protein